MCHHCCHCYGLLCLLDLGVVVDKGGVQALGHLGVVVIGVSVQALGHLHAREKAGHGSSYPACGEVYACICLLFLFFC